MTLRISPHEFQCLLEYYTQCIRQEDVLNQSFESTAEGKTFYTSFTDKECFFHTQQTTVHLQKSEALQRCYQQHHSHQHTKPLYYGYPLCIDPDGKISPVFFAEVTLTDAGETFLVTQTSKNVELNTNVLATYGFEREETTTILAEIAEEKQIHQKLKTLLELLPHTPPLTPTLHPWKPGQPTDLQILNNAILYYDEHSSITRALLAELHKLQSLHFSKIKKSALSGFLHHRPSRKIRSTMGTEVLEVFPMNPSQEQSVRNALTKPITVITGPPGTGKSQVVLNIIANAVFQNKTVLFASKNNKAVDVVVQKLNTILTYPLIIRMGNKIHRNNAKITIQRILTQIPFPVDNRPLIDKISKLHCLTTELNRLRKSCNPTDEFITMHPYQKRLIKEKILFFQHHQKKEDKRDLSTNPTRACVQTQTPYQEAELQKQKIMISREILEQYWLEKINKNESLLRYRISRYLDVSERMEQQIKSPRLWRQLDADQKNELQEILPGLPVWVVTNLSVKNSFPFTPAVFDLVIIDEASQCDIASALPLLARSKQAVIIGDPKQLRHISLLKQSQEETIAAECNIKHRFFEYSYSRHSLYDLAEQTVTLQGEQPLLLNEHYRSHHDIITFSNKYFYGGKLRIATNEQNLVAEPNLPQGIIWHNVQGRTMPTKSPCCPEEVAYVVDLLQQLKIGDKKHISFGIVTLFRMQMEMILEKIKTIENLQGLNLTVGTAHRFQGDEKDVIIFSLGVSEGVRSSTLRWIETTTQLLNVGITRAKSLVIIVGDKHTCSLAKGILHDLVEYVDRKK